jgi:Alpha-glutamyl/putrescinyl thymine pyrophosphorylase clade 2
MPELKAGTDFRRVEHRREVFLRFLEWSHRYRSFPGGVHYVLPHMARELELDLEQRYWLAWLNANTQNPVTSLLLLQAAPRLEDWPRAVEFWRANYRSLDWDTDRRYHKARFEDAVRGYAGAVACGCFTPQHKYFRVGFEWGAWWDRAFALPTMGRLSTWSYLEYLRILLGASAVPDADTLMLEDIQGSRSHRNGLALVMGAEEWIVDKQLGQGATDEIYKNPVRMELLGQWAHQLHTEAQARVPGADRLSLESALCTYKGWHKPNRRYPGVYNDMLYNRLVGAENRWGRRFGIIWDARRVALPERLRLEDQPYDPGLSPVKQNWYLQTGEVINMTEDWECFRNGFEKKVAAQEFGPRPRAWI